MKILITDPNGHVGRKLIPELLGPEFSVRVIARDTSCLPRHMLERVEVVRGSTDDFATLHRALDGVEAMLWCVPSESVELENFRDRYQRLARVACQAIHASRTPRVVTISASGNPVGPGADSISAARAMEEILNHSGAAVRHLRSGWFMDNFQQQAHRICGQGVLAYPIPGHIPLPMVAARDIAEAALQRLVRRDWAGIRTVSILGPGEVSFNQVAFTMERVLNRNVKFTEISANTFIRDLIRSGIDIHAARRMIGMLETWSQGLPWRATQTNELIGPTTLAEWTKRELRPKMHEFGPPGWRLPMRFMEPAIA
jgi:uncharacterized protein YbjT (DUF2867 family)